jgi:branched-chain amino acid transport system ATP-binding protein
LAPIIVQEILAAIRRITREEGMTAIIVEQHPKMILAISDEALVLDRGQVVLQESAANLLDRPDLLGDLLGVKH